VREEGGNIIEHVWPEVGQGLEMLVVVGVSRDREQAIVALPLLVLLAALADLQDAD
jgi:hypothetical protein